MLWLVNGEYRMLWILAALTMVAGILALMVVSVKRPADVGELGAVSDRWIAKHRADVP
jgi:hypothetical protein